MFTQGANQRILLQTFDRRVHAVQQALRRPFAIRCYPCIGFGKIIEKFRATDDAHGGRLALAGCKTTSNFVANGLRIPGDARPAGLALGDQRPHRFF